MHKKVLHTEFTVLRKTPYMESSIIVSGLSPEFGKLDLLIKGDRRISKKKSPEIDLFRVYAVEFVEKTSSIINPLLIEFIREHDKVALYPERLNELFRAASFLLKNEHYNIHCPMVYSALGKYLERFSRNEVASLMHLKLVYLHENGLLPHTLTSSSQEDEARAKAALRLLFDYAIGATGQLHLSLNSEYGLSLERWIDSLCSANHHL